MSAAPLVITDEALCDLGQRLRQTGARAAAAGHRHLLGLAGLPGSGKSTLALQLVAAVNAGQDGGGPAVVVPLDGFHLPNAELQARGLLPRKGAPETFDFPGYKALLVTLGPYPAGRAIPFPLYDRQRHEPVWPDPAEVAQAGVNDRHTVIITEGNYLLLNQPPWTDLAGLLHETWFLDVPPPLAAERLIARHVQGGRSPASAREHFERSDRLNAQAVLACRREADRHLCWP